jgi:hypothetical protein
LIFSLLLLSGCGFLGDTKSINAATDLAIDCSTDEALAALDKAEEGGGLSKYLAALEWVGILRDAGRDGEANEALAAYKALPEAASSSDEEIERSLDEFIEGLREERRERTGSPTCPG